MWVVLTCSRCGKHHRMSSNRPEHSVKMAQAGWRNYGTALYCPDCADTWYERNDKPLGNELDVIQRILVILRHATKEV